MTDPIQHLRPYLDAPLEECNDMGSTRTALILAAVAIAAGLGMWGVLAMITWAAT